MNVEGVCCKALLKQGIPNTKHDFRSVVKSSLRIPIIAMKQSLKTDCHTSRSQGRPLESQKLYSGKEKSFCSKRSLSGVEMAFRLRSTTIRHLDSDSDASERKKHFVPTYREFDASKGKSKIIICLQIFPIKST